MKNPLGTPTVEKIIEQARRFSLKQVTYVTAAFVVAGLLGLATFHILATDDRAAKESQLTQISLRDDDRISIDKPPEVSQPTKSNPTTNETPSEPETPPADDTKPATEVKPEPTDTGSGQTNSEPSTAPQQPPAQTPQVPQQTPRPANPTPPPAAPTWSPEAQQMLTLVNQARATASVPALVLNAALTEAANIRAYELVSVQGHTRPNGQLWYTVSSLARGENVAAGQTSVQKVFDAWMNSEGHRDNILRPEFRTLGVGYYYQNNTGYLHYWAQLFGV
jgi:uncharacterized protein YkwD